MLLVSLIQGFMKKSNNITLEGTRATATQPVVNGGFSTSQNTCNSRHILKITAQTVRIVAIVVVSRRFILIVH